MAEKSKTQNVPLITTPSTMKILIINTKFVCSVQHAIPLSQQLEYYKEYQSKLAQIVGSSKAHSIITGALYILSAGSSDFVQNYYINPYLNKLQSPDDFSNLLIGIFNNFVKVLNIYAC
jgi:hypothetical protein